MRYVVNSNRWWMGVFILALAVIPVVAQVDIGTISGTVVDTSDAVVPGVRMIIQNEGNLTTQEATTNSSGYYIFPSLMVGDYTVIAEMKGFKKFVQTGIHSGPFECSDPFIAWRDESDRCSEWGRAPSTLVGADHRRHRHFLSNATA